MGSKINDATVALAFNRGHNDGFLQRTFNPHEPDGTHGYDCLCCERYKEGYEKGDAAGYWYRAGVADGRRAG